MELSTESLKNALSSAHISANEIDHLVTATCTGYICPGLSSYLVESCALRNNVTAVDLVGMGCGAALPALQQAINHVKAHPGTVGTVVSTEICSAAMFSSDDPDIVISNTIFSDGSAAAVVKSFEKEDSPGPNGPVRPRLRGFSSITVPAWRETLRFTTQNGYLKNVLGKEVPDHAAKSISRVVEELLKKNDLSRHLVKHWIVHTGGEKILNAIQRELHLSDDRLASSRRILRNYGNISSPTVLFVMEDVNRSKPCPGDYGVMCSFGAGFSAHAALVEY